MGAHVVITCDGHHDRERCVSQTVTSSRHAPTAVAEARSRGWRSVPGVGYLCPSPSGHDEPVPAARDEGDRASGARTASAMS